MLLTALAEAVVSEVIDGYILTASRDTIALIGDRVELNCTTNSSSTVWNFIRYGSSKEEWISRGNRTRPNISDAYSILSNEVGQFALIIDPMLKLLAGRYVCRDTDEVNPFSAEVTVLSKKIFWTFLEQFAVTDDDEADDDDDDEEDDDDNEGNEKDDDGEWNSRY